MSFPNKYNISSATKCASKRVRISCLCTEGRIDSVHSSKPFRGTAGRKTNKSLYCTFLVFIIPLTFVNLFCIIFALISGCQHSDKVLTLSDIH